MTKFLFALLLTPLTVSAALLPEALGQYERTKVTIHTPSEKNLHLEFGFEEGEIAHYIDITGQSVSITASRFRDPTGAFAAFLWLHPSRGIQKPYGEASFQNGKYTLIRFGNYVIEMEGAEPIEEHIELMLAFLPRIQMAALPPMLVYFPTDQLVSHSAKHILGPLGLQEIAPKIPPSIAAFHFGTEAHYGRYATPSGEHRLLLFSYPTPQISRGQLNAFNGLTDVIAKRSGPLVAVIPDPPSLDEAQHLLARVRYVTEVTPHHREPSRSENLATLLIDIIIFCALLALLMICGGGIVAGTRMLAGKYAPNSILAPPDENNITRLDIDTH